MEYVSRIRQLEDLYDNPVKFEEVVKEVKGQIHSGRYNRGEWLNVLRKLTYGLKDSYDVCETNINCLLEHELEFLNYAHDHEPMIHLLTYGSVELVDRVVSSFPVEKLIGFRNEHEPRLSLFQDLNMNCPVMVALDLLRTSKGKDSIEYKQKLESMLKKLPLGFNFTLKYISNHRLYYTTPLARMILQNDPLMSDYIKLHGGTLDTVINEPLCTSCGKSYYTFVQNEPIHLSFLDYVQQTNPKDYALLVKQTRTLKNRKGLQRKHESRSQPSVQMNVKGTSLNQPTTMNNLKERIRMNKEKRDLLMDSTVSKKTKSKGRPVGYKTRKHKVSS
jgi:hypothetical protein